MASASAMPSDSSTAVGVNQGRPRTHATPVLSSMRIDQVGGLVAPPSLREACRHLEAGRIGAEEMRAAEGVAIRAVLRKQEEIGIPVLSDGELRRKNFQEGFSLMPP